jgi:hypothetical protein
MEAKRVDVEKAEKVARLYARITPRLTTRQDLKLSKTVSRPVDRTRPAMRRAAQPQDETMFYVFSMNGNGGFILVAGDDIAKPVLGYSDTGTYDENNPNLAYWMESLSQEIAYAIENSATQDDQTKAAWEAFAAETDIQSQSDGDHVEPLIKTKWNQSPPYNDRCPEISGERAVTGCVATAMAQIMKYHEYPTTRTVEIPGYTKSGINISAITGQTTYRWSDMSNTYSTLSTDESKTAVAELMYQCGVSVKMNYSLTGSGASSSEVVPALKTYFDYDAGIIYLDRNYYSYTEWINLLKTELKANRPIYYDGNSDSNGHAFVCDGYDANNLFHFNWGWGGSSDGYFEVSALNPGSVGIGGGSDGYNKNQSIIIGIQPNKGGQPVIQLGLSTFSVSKSSLTDLTEPFGVSADHLKNIGLATVTDVYLGVLLCNQDGSYYDHKTYPQNLNLPPFYSYDSKNLLSEYSLPSSTPVGRYKLYPAFSASSEIPSIISSTNGYKYIIVDVKADGSVTLTESSDKPNLSLISLQSLRTVYQNKTGYFTAEITNSGAADYNSKLTLQLGSQTVATDPVVIPAETTKIVEFSDTITLDPDTYPLSILYDTENTPDGSPSVQLGNSVLIEVKAEPTEEPNLSLVSVSFPNNDAVDINYPDLTVEIKNDGGLYDKSIIVFIFPEDRGNSIIGLIATNIWIEKDETQSIRFTNPLYNLEIGVRYMYRVYYYDGVGTQVVFDGRFYFTTATDTPVSIDAQTPVITAHPQSAEYTKNATATPILVTANVSDDGTLTYQWYSNTNNTNTGGSVIDGATSANYTPPTNAVGVTYYYAVITNTNTSANITGQQTATIKSNPASITVNKISPPAPAAPTLETKTAVSITLNAIDGDVEYSIDGERWQDSRIFSGLAPNTPYIFYARYKENDRQTVSPSSAPSETFTTDKAALAGTVTISGKAIFGETLTAETSALTSTPVIVELGSLSYQWKRNNVDIPNATAATYTLVREDIDATVTVTVAADNTSGNVVSVPAIAISKAEQSAPVAPTLETKTAESITLNAIDGDVEYSIDGERWQDSRTFSGLAPDAEYTFYARMKETDTHNASPASEGYNITTDTDAELVRLTVNSKQPSVAGNEFSYQATCGETSVTLDVVPATAIVTVGDVRYGNQPIPLSDDSTVINIKTVSSNRQTTNNYRLTIANSLDANKILFKRWSDVVAVNRNAADGKYRDIDSVRWVVGGEERKEWYIRLSNGEDYSVEIHRAGKWHNVCGEPQTNIRKIIAYPNPVTVGENMNLQLPESFTGGYVDVISLAGSTTKRKLPLPNTINIISVADWSPGIYLLNIVAPNGDRETIKIIVIN